MTADRLDIGHYRLVVFDCDGTLVDSQHNIVAGMIAAWRRYGLEDPTPEAVRRQVGLTLEIAIERMLGRDDPATVANLAAADAVVPVDDLPSYLVMSFGAAELTADGLWLPGHGVAIVSV